MISLIVLEVFMMLDSEVTGRKSQVLSVSKRAVVNSVHPISRQTLKPFLLRDAICHEGLHCKRPVQQVAQR